MNVVCSTGCKFTLSSYCVFYEGESLLYTGIVTNDNLQTALQKIDQAFSNASLGYAFVNGTTLISGNQAGLGGSLIQDTSITGNYKVTFEGQLESSAFITTGGTSSQFVKGDGTLDSTSYQLSGNYITDLTGDGTASGPGSSLFTLATVFGAPGTYGNSTTVPTITVDGKGRITNITNSVINLPSDSLSFQGDVTGLGVTGAPVTLTLNTVNSNVFVPNTPLKFGVNGKGLVTSAALITNLDLDAIYGYTPVPNSRTITINGDTKNLANDRSWTITGTGHTIQYNGTTLTNRANLNFTGTGVVVTDDAGNNATVVTISGGGGSAAWGSIGAGTGVASQTDLITYLDSNYYPLASNPAGYITNLSSFTTDDLAEGATNLYFTNTRAITSLTGQNISIFTNNSGYITSSSPNNLTNKTGLISQWTNDSGYITSAALTGYVPNTRTLTINGTFFDLSANRSWSVGTVTSVGLTMPAAFTVTNSPIASSGDIAVTGAGITSQYVRGDGSLGNFPSVSGGGASVNYYLNGSVASGVAGYEQMSKTAVIGIGTDFSTSSDGYIASFLTDTLDPGQLSIPGGNWIFRCYFDVSSSGGTPYFYVELYKYDGSFTLLASSVLNPEYITGGTTIDLYTTALAVPTTALLTTDRLAIRIYTNVSGRTITLHTEDSNLCEVSTTFSTGITALNGLTDQVQYFATGTTGSDFNISSSTDTHTFNLPTASATNRGALSSTDWSTFNGKGDVFGPASAVNNNFAAFDLTTGKLIKDSGYNSSSFQPAGTYVTSVSGTTNRITSTGGVTPVIDISAAYVGQTSITTLGTIATGTWQGSSISTTYTDAKIKTVTGTLNRLTIGGTSTDPTFDISTSYVGQNTITTLGTITTGTWNSTVIGAQYGGTGQNTSASTGVAQVTAGVWSVSPTLANNTLATTQAANDNSTKVATTAYVDNAVTAGPFWKLTGTSTLTGVSTITSNLANGLVFTGTWTATASNQIHYLINPTITGSGGASNTTYIAQNFGAVTQGANNQTFIAYDISAPTLTTGGFTGGISAALSVRGRSVFGNSSSQLNSILSFNFEHASVSDSFVGYFNGLSLTGATASGVAGVAPSAAGTFNKTTYTYTPKAAVVGYTSGANNAAVVGRIANATAVGFDFAVESLTNYNQVMGRLVYNGATLTATNSNPMLYIGRSTTSLGAFDLTGAMIELEHNSTATGNFLNLIGASSTVKFQVKSTGDTGINVTPTAKLHVKGTGTTTSELFRLDDSASTNRFLVLDNGTTTITGNVTVTDTYNLSFGTTTGTKIGTSTTQKIGFFNSTPIVQPTGWTAPTGTLSRTGYDTSTVTVAQLAQNLAALITDLKSLGLIG